MTAPPSIAAPSLPWAAEALWQELAPLQPGLTVEVAAELTSTNSTLTERLRQPGADTSPCLLVAEKQTAGRGRMGRVWHASAGASLTFSIAVPMNPPDWSGLSLAVGVALADALDQQPPRIGLKWPNDLCWLDSGRKLGGILIETVGVGAQRVAVIGVGLNIAAQAEMPADISAGWLNEFDSTLDAPGCLRRVAAPLLHALQAFEQQGFAAFASRYAARDMLHGRAVSTTSPMAAHGTAVGVSATGGLRIQVGETEQVLTSGEVSVRAVNADGSGLMLRTLVLILAILNALFFIWTRGWLDGMLGTRAFGEHEPDRLTRQSNVQAIKLMSPTAVAAALAASAAKNANAGVCLEAGPFTGAQFSVAQQAVDGIAPGKWTSVEQSRPGDYVVFMGPYLNAEVLHKKQFELQRLKLTPDELPDPAGGGMVGLSMGRFDNHAEAEAKLVALAQRGVRTARLVVITPALSGQWLRVEHANTNLANQLKQLKPPAVPATGFVACAPAPAASAASAASAAP